MTHVTVTNAQTIAAYAFENCASLKTVELNNDIISIDAGAFRGCTSLRELTVPSDVMAIPEEMMRNCTSLKAFYYEASSVSTIGEDAFAGCAALEMINSDESGAFVFSENLTSIGKGALNGCVKLKKLTVPFIGESRNPSENAAMFGYIFGTTAYTGGNATVQDWNGDAWNEVTYYIPVQLKLVMVTDAMQIADYAFENCSTLTELLINEGAQSYVGVDAFKNCVTPTYITIQFNDNSEINFDFVTIY